MLLGLWRKRADYIRMQAFCPRTSTFKSFLMTNPLLKALSNVSVDFRTEMRAIRSMGTVCAISLLVSGCMFGKLKDDLVALDAAVSIKGHVSGQSSEDNPIFISLYSDDGLGQFTLSTYSVRFGEGDFEFLVSSGDYFLFAFEDDNEDFEFQHEENVGWYGEPTLLRPEPGAQITDADIVLRPPDEARGALPEIYAPDVPALRMQLETIQLGEVVSFDDARFSREVGVLGLWQPVRFYELGNSGLFFLEPYDPNKIPVLFVHGIGGYAGEWQPFIEQLDRKRFQPWIVQYPSGFRLDLLSDRFSASVRKLKVKYGFDSLYVVAHSMGGLLSRGFINKYVATGDVETIGVLITLSTPWQGHAAAQVGVNRAPTVIPVWYDLVPGSPYIESLFESTAPDCFPYYLLFSYRGRGSIRSKDNSDGTVTLLSQLSLPAQDEAERVLGFNEDHTSILRSKTVFDRVNQILEQTAADSHNSVSCSELAPAEQ